MQQSRAGVFKPALIAGFLNLLAWGQDSAPRPQFEVAEVRVNPGGPIFDSRNAAAIASLRSGALHPDTNITLRSVTMAQLLTLAYKEIMRAGEYLSGGTDWIRSDHFDVRAKAPPGTSADTERLMLQALLAERFHLKVHIEQKRKPVFELVLGKKGPKLRPAAEAGEAECHRQAEALPPRYQGFTCHSVTVAFLAVRLQELFGFALPAVDATGLTGTYDVAFSYPVQLHAMMLSYEFAGEPLPPDFSKAWEDALGLRVEETTRLMPVVVIDHLDRIPNGN